MRVDLFDFELPPDRIALRPARPRDAARLLVVRPGAVPELEDRVVRDLPAILAPGDALVLNDTRVVPVQLAGERRRAGGAAAVSATLTKRLAPDRCRAFVKPGRRLGIGDRIRFGRDGRGPHRSLDATVVGKAGGEAELAFDASGPALDEVLAEIADMPLPPYIAGRRPADEADREDYQTVYAERDGAVAAPTAGLHFTDRLFAALDARGISRHFVTLHVGPGTFLPVKVEDTEAHRMHAEWGEVSVGVAAALNQVRAAGGRIVAVGTTSLRLLETAVDRQRAFRPFAGETDIFISPGRPVRSADLLMTNFHLPRSTLFMLVCAFSGVDVMKRAYDHAVAARYRFYSYGDACLLHRAEAP